MKQKKMKKILVLGMGKVGTLVGILLKKSGFQVTGLDSIIDEQKAKDLPFKTINMDIEDKNSKKLEEIFGKHDAVVSCLPFFLNETVVDIALNAEIHYFDLTEDIETTKYIRGHCIKAQHKECYLVPQCGLAPGLIGIIGEHLIKQFEKVDTLELRVGALPQHPKGALGYAFNWSAEGVINEYVKDCEVILDHERKFIPSLGDKEILTISGKQFEACTTSGGLGTLCDKYKGKIRNLDYKSIRYPGHFDIMKLLLNDLGFRKYYTDGLDSVGHDGDILMDRLLQTYPPVKDDIVYIYATCLGLKDKSNSENFEREEIIKELTPVTIGNETWRAISWTTAASLVATIELVANGKIKHFGFVSQEEFMYNDLIKTRTMKSVGYN